MKKYMISLGGTKAVPPMPEAGIINVIARTDDHIGGHHRVYEIDRDETKNSVVVPRKGMIELYKENDHTATIKELDFDEVGELVIKEAGTIENLAFAQIPSDVTPNKDASLCLDQVRLDDDLLFVVYIEEDGEATDYRYIGVSEDDAREVFGKMA